IFTSTDQVVQVNGSAATGDMDVLANHTPSIEHIRPGVVEVILEYKSSLALGSGGCTNAHPVSNQHINIVEAAPPESFSPKAVSAKLHGALKVATGNGSEEEKIGSRKV
ncbi:hypothetical protein SCLCIDRAFT_117811, partial [Scleroderma citrinum Foug A]